MYPLDHIGIVVREVAQAATLWENLLGWKVVARDEDPERGLRFVFLARGEGNTPRLELIMPLREDTAVQKFLEKRGEGLHHLAFRVPALDHALDRYVQEGYRVVEGPRMGALGHRIAFLHPADTGRVLVELVEHSGR